MHAEEGGWCALWDAVWEGCEGARWCAQCLVGYVAAVIGRDGRLVHPCRPAVRAALVALGAPLPRSRLRRLLGGRRTRKGRREPP